VPRNIAEQVQACHEIVYRGSSIKHENITRLENHSHKQDARVDTTEKEVDNLSTHDVDVGLEHGRHQRQ